MERQGFLRSGGWIVVAALVLTAVVFARHAALMLASRSRAVGDGRHPASYGFALSPSLIPTGEIVASGMPRDGLPALVEPASWSTAELANADRTRRGKLLVPSDRVIGVVAGGQARAYPLRFLVWHEVVNDSLGGVPIVVTYNPLCDSSVVFLRTVAGSARIFGVSGLLYNSNLLMYERTPAGKGESLWSQLLLRAVTGPAAAAGLRLALVPASVEAWTDWLTAHPETTILAPDVRLAEQYKRDPYGSYFGSDELRFPVRPSAPPGALPNKTPVVVVERAERFVAFPFPVVAAHAGAAGEWHTSAAGLSLLLRWHERPPTVTVAPAAGFPEPGVLYASFFAWYAMHPGDTTWIGLDTAAAPPLETKVDPGGQARFVGCGLREPLGS